MDRKICIRVCGVSKNGVWGKFVLFSISLFKKTRFDTKGISLYQRVSFRKRSI